MGILASLLQKRSEDGSGTGKCEIFIGEFKKMYSKDMMPDDINCAVSYRSMWG